MCFKILFPRFIQFWQSCIKFSHYNYGLCISLYIFITLSFLCFALYFITLFCTQFNNYCKFSSNFFYYWRRERCYILNSLKLDSFSFSRLKVYVLQELFKLFTFSVNICMFEFYMNTYFYIFYNIYHSFAFSLLFSFC